MSDKGKLMGTPLCHGGVSGGVGADVRYTHMQCELEQARKELIDERTARGEAEAKEASATEHARALGRGIAHLSELLDQRDAVVDGLSDMVELNALKARIAESGTINISIDKEKR